MQSLVTETQLMQQLCISRTTAWRLRQAGLPCIRLGRGIRYNVEQALEWIANNGGAIAPNVTASVRGA